MSVFCFFYEQCGRVAIIQKNCRLFLKFDMNHRRPIERDVESGGGGRVALAYRF